MAVEKVLALGLAIAVLVALGSYSVSSFEGLERSTATYGAKLRELVNMAP